MSRVRLLSKWTDQDTYAKYSSKHFKNGRPTYRLHAPTGRPEVGEGYEVLCYVEMPKGHKCSENDLEKLKEVIRKDSHFFKVFEERLNGEEEKVFSDLLD